MDIKSKNLRGGETSGLEIFTNSHERQAVIGQMSNLTVRLLAWCKRRVVGIGWCVHQQGCTVGSVSETLIVPVRGIAGEMRAGRLPPSCGFEEGVDFGLAGRAC